MTTQFHTSDSRSFDSYEAYREHLRAHPGVRGYGTCLPRGKAQVAKADAEVKQRAENHEHLVIRALVDEVKALRERVAQLEAQAHTHKRRTKS